MRDVGESLGLDHQKSHGDKQEGGACYKCSSLGSKFPPAVPTWQLQVAASLTCRAKAMVQLKSN